MKRFLCLVLCAGLLLTALTACGSKAEQQEAAAEESTTVQALEIQDDDTMNMNMLFSFIDTPDVGVTELMGDGDSQEYQSNGDLKSRTYGGRAYGCNIVFVVYYNEYEDVSSVEAYFPDDVSEEQLAATVTELTGKQRGEDGIWQADNAAVSLVKENNDLRIRLTAHTGDGTEE